MHTKSSLNDLRRGWIEVWNAKVISRSLLYMLKRKREDKERKKRKR